MKNFRQKNFGLTLLEALVTLFMLLVAFSMISALVGNFSDVTAHLKGKEGAQRGSLLLLTVATDVEGAFSVVTPAAGAGTLSTEIVLKKFVSPSTRLVAGNTSTNWEAAHTMTIRYHQQGEDLVRDVIFPDGTEHSGVIASQVSGFSGKRVNDHSIEVRASFREDKRVTTTAVLAYRWGE